MDRTDSAEIERVAESLRTAWNNADGTAFARSFTDDADFVNIYAMHLSGRDAIAKQHQAIFDGVYRGSRVAFTLKKTRPFADGVVLAHIASDLHVPQGPMAGQIHTLATVLLVRERAGWLIASFHNTREQPLPAPTSAELET